MKYYKYFRKTSIKDKEVGRLFLEEIQKKNPKTFLEIGIFHGVTARNICNLMYKNHGSEFKYIGIDIFEEGDGVKNEVAPSFKFNNPLKTFYFKYLKRYYIMNHMNVSFVKSTIRMLGCILGILLQSITVLGFLLLLAEVLGIIEEVVDKREEI